MQSDKEMQMKILEQIMEEMDDYEFESKLKPIMSVKVEKSGVKGLPGSLRDLLDGKSGKCSPEMMEEEEMPMIKKKDMGDEDDLDSRFARLLAKKRA